MHEYNSKILHIGRDALYMQEYNSKILGVCRNTILSNFIYAGIQFKDTVDRHEYNSKIL